MVSFTNPLVTITVPRCHLPIRGVIYHPRCYLPIRGVIYQSAVLFTIRGVIYHSAVLFTNPRCNLPIRRSITDQQKKKKMVKTDPNLFFCTLYRYNLKKKKIISLHNPFNCLLFNIVYIDIVLSFIIKLWGKTMLIFTEITELTNHIMDTQIFHSKTGKIQLYWLYINNYQKATE